MREPSRARTCFSVDQAERRIRQHTHFDLLGRQCFVQRPVTRQCCRWGVFWLTCAPATAQRGLRRSCRNEVLRVQVRIADDAHGSGDLRDGFTRHLE